MPAEACDLKLELFETDRETVAWEVGTWPDHAAPYLVMPDRYAEQEVDVATGGATIGTVGVTVIDRAQIDGDQDSGWMTQRLHTSLGLPAVKGRRCRLSRLVDGEWVMVADGPASAPRMDSSYAGFTWEINDTRETERQIRAFDRASTLLAFPEAVREGYGYDADSATYLLDPVDPAQGETQDRQPVLEAGTVRIEMTSMADPNRTVYNATSMAQLLGTVTMLPEEEHGPETGFESFGTWTEFPYEVRFTNVELHWRPVAGGAWHIIPAERLVIKGRYAEDDPWAGDPSPPAAPPRFTSLTGAGISYSLTQNVGGIVITTPGTLARFVVFGDDAAVPDVPADGVDIELFIVQHYTPSRQRPAHVDQQTAGEFVQDAYDGVYSPRDAEGNVVPTGIRYDAAALAQMTDPVTIRVTAPVDDLRTWLETNIYAPTGWVPALDAEGQISPISQETPESTSGLPSISDATAEPRADWDAGSRTINQIVLEYVRDYLPADIADAETGDRLSERVVIAEFEDPVSVQQNGPHPLRLSGAAFRARGTDEVAASFLGDITLETAYQLATERYQHVLNRYSMGAPSFVVSVMRELYPDLRAGDWLIASLSWLPDPITRRRGFLGLVQVLAINDLDCAWREILCEAVNATS